MAEGFTLVVATVGGGLSRTVDGGETWDRIRDPIPSESTIRALSVYPDNPHRILEEFVDAIRLGDDIDKLRSELLSPQR